MPSQANKIARLRNRWVCAQHEVAKAEQQVRMKERVLEFAREHFETDLKEQVIQINHLEDAKADLIYAKNRLKYLEDHYSKLSPHVKRQVMK